MTGVQTCALPSVGVNEPPVAPLIATQPEGALAAKFPVAETASPVDEHEYHCLATVTVPAPAQTPGVEAYETPKVGVPEIDAGVSAEGVETILKFALT